jgi:hypothetical protein
VGILPRWDRADDSGCPRAAEEGNVVAHAPQSSCTRRRHDSSSHALSGDASFARSFDPLGVNPHYTRRHQKCRSWWGGRFGITVGQALVRGKNQHWGWANGRWRLAAHHRFRKEGSVVRSEKEGGRGLRPCEDQGSPGSIARTSCFSCRESVGDYWPRISSANALQKERSGSSERGPSSG